MAGLQDRSGARSLPWDPVAAGVNVVAWSMECNETAHSR